MTLEQLARGVAVGAFLGVAVVVMLRGRTSVRVAGGLFSLAAGAHVLTQTPGPLAAFGWAGPAIWALSAAAAGLFWTFATTLFKDERRNVPLSCLPAAILLTLAILARVSPDAISRGLWLAHNLVGLGLMAHVLVVVGTGWRDDLVESRRRLRGPMLGAAALYAIGVQAVQSGELFLGSAEALSPLAASILAVLGLASLAVFTQANPALFDATTAATPPAPTLDGQDEALAARLDRLMREERLYRRDGLTIAAVALALRTPEHRLRRLINQRLGHRNFAAFLNQWRLAEAKAALADPAQAEVPVSTIALDAGYGSLGPFNRAFKAETGRTPSAYRAEALTPVRTNR
ncbi:MAG: transcriptional regulator, AraC family [Caulobacter sp.]|nr:transcriptional regulator, AraC family [Caulobacter sp.]